MQAAIEICKVPGLVRVFLKPFVPTVETIADDQRSTMACPACKRAYGSLPSYPALEKKFSIVKCPCGKFHLGFRPFDGYQ